MSKMKVRIEFDCELEGIAQRDSGIRETQEKRELERDIEKYIDYIFNEIFVYHEYDLFEGIYHKDNQVKVRVNLQDMPKMYNTVCDYLKEKETNQILPEYR